MMKRAVKLGMFFFLPFSVCDAQLHDPFFSAAGQEMPAGSSVLIPTTARAWGMGSAGVASSSGAEAMFWNPAGMGMDTSRLSLSVQGGPWLSALGIRGLSHFSAAFSMPVHPRRKLFVGASLTYVHLEGLDMLVRNDPVDPGIRFEMAAGASVARWLTPRLSVSVTGRYLHSRFAPHTPGNVGQAGLFMGDAGLHYHRRWALGKTPCSLSIGLVLANLGPKARYSGSNRDAFLPASVQAGYAVSMELSPTHALTFSQDGSRLMVPLAGGNVARSAMGGMWSSWSDSPEGWSGELREIRTGFGVEYSWKSMLMWRTGYRWVHPEIGTHRAITVGAGGRWHSFQIDVAYWLTELNTPFQNSWRIGLGWRA